LTRRSPVRIVRKGPAPVRRLAGSVTPALRRPRFGTLSSRDAPPPRRRFTSRSRRRRRAAGAASSPMQVKPRGGAWRTTMQARGRCRDASSAQVTVTYPGDGKLGRQTAGRRITKS
jgi:hypothetical protein